VNRGHGLLRFVLLTSLPCSRRWLGLRQIVPPFVRRLFFSLPCVVLCFFFSFWWARPLRFPSPLFRGSLPLPKRIPRVSHPRLTLGNQPQSYGILLGSRLHPSPIFIGIRCLSPQLAPPLVRSRPQPRGVCCATVFPLVRFFVFNPQFEK